jgi:hypothetical protein
VLVDETLTYLEMTSPDQLVPGRLPPAPMDLELHSRASLPLLRSTYARIGAAYGWTTRPAWSDAHWEQWLSSPGVQPWIARVGGEVAGMVELGASAGRRGRDRRPRPRPGVRRQGFRGALVDLGHPPGVGGRASQRGTHQPRVVADLLARPSARVTELSAARLPCLPNRAAAATGPRVIRYRGPAALPTRQARSFHKVGRGDRRGSGRRRPGQPSRSRAIVRLAFRP